MALPFLDRLLTIVVTATVTSAAWVVAGGFHPLERASAGPTPSALGAGPRTGAAPTAAAAGGRLIIPVAGVRAGQLSDSFEQDRGGGRKHHAIDIMAPAGTPVVAAAPGTVEKLFRSKAGGNTIYVRTADRTIIHYYAHLQDYAPGLHEAQTVRQGEALGRVGSTGDADPAAPHLHFEVQSTSPQKKWWEPTTPLNPYPLLVH